MSDQLPRVLLLDTASLYFRAFYGMKDLNRTPGGQATNALRGVLDMVTTLTTRFSPTAVVACWDEDWRPDFRVQAIPTYKAHRLAEGSDDAEDTPDELAPQVPVIRHTLEAIGLPVLGAQGYEADDVIGTLTHRLRGHAAVDVVTGDRDLFQLIDDTAHVRVVYTAKGGVRGAEVLTQEDLQERYGIGSGAAYLDMAVLRGDSSDGLPGVKGIGDKSAAQLINQFGSLAALREALAAGDPSIKGAKRANLEAASDYLDVAPAVVRVAPGAPVPDDKLELPTELHDPEMLQQVVEAYAISGPVSRLLSALGMAA